MHVRRDLSDHSNEDDDEDLRINESIYAPGLAKKKKKKTQMLLAAAVQCLMGDRCIEPARQRGRIPSCTQKKDQSEVLTWR